MSREKKPKDKSHGVPYWLAMVRKYPNSAKAWFALGVELGNTDRAGESEAAHRRAISLNPRWAQPWCGLGAALCDQDKLTEGKVALRCALQLDPQHDVAHFDLGLACAETGRFGEAKRHLDQYCRLSSAEGLSTAAAKCKVATSLLEFAIYYEKYGDYSKDRKMYPRAFRIVDLSLKYEQSLEGLLLAAYLMDFRMHHPKRALELYHAAASLCPGEVRAWHGMAGAYLGLRWYQKAMDCVARGLELSRKGRTEHTYEVKLWSMAHEDLYVIKAVILVGEGNMASALAAIDEGLKRFPKSKWLRHWRKTFPT